MNSGSAVSGSKPGSAGQLPLIWCTEYGGSRVVQRRSRKEWSKGQIFFCCPFYEMDGSGCPFWYWEDDYVKLLESKGIISGRSVRMEAGAEGGGIISGCNVRMPAEVEAGGSAMAQIGSPIEGSGVGKEIVNLLKITCFVSVLCYL